MDRSISHRSAFGSSGFRGLLVVAGLAIVAASATALASEPCGTGSYPFPYTDVASVTDPFCPGIMEAYVTGISKGTSPTTFSSNEDVIRLQMTTFLQRTVDQVLARASSRAALNHWSTPQNTTAMQTIALAGFPIFCAADGENIWVSDSASRVAQIQASTGTNLNHWTGASNPQGVLVASGKVFVAADTSPGALYVFDPSQPPGAVTIAANNLGDTPFNLTFDGTHLWTANQGGGSVSIITPQATLPYPVTTITTGFNQPYGILYDGSHVWVTDFAAGTLLKLDPSGAILRTVTVGTSPRFPAFDGANIWVPNFTSNSITVVQASSGNIVATISADATNHLNGPEVASFDGDRVLVTNGAAGTVTVFKAADLSFIANVATPGVFSACSDGLNFWLAATNLLRF